MTGTLLALLVPLALLALGALVAYRVADRVARSQLVPEPYGLQPEFTLRSVAPDPDDTTRVRLVLPLPSGRHVPQVARVDAEGRYGLLWDDDGAIGHGWLGPVLARDAQHVTRSLAPVSGAPPRPGAPARLDATVYRRDPLRDHGLPFDEVRIDGPVGELAAWWLERPGDAAVVMVHGRRRGERNEALRALPVIAASGASVLVSSYRNHDSSDPSPDGLFHYGAGEADDLLAALVWLRARDVARVVLVTYSMGGALALLARERWPADAPRLLAITLDAPLVDPREVLRHGVQRTGLPAVAADLGLRLASRRTGVDFGALDLRRLAPTLDVPLLLHATAQDGTIPVALVDDFAARVPPRLLSYRRRERGDHVEAWNVDPRGYEAALGTFVAGALAR